ncbi:MAG: carboxypeptidase regulatory-like domain-containing protein, partial [Bryobacteraceae bacterium]
MRIHARVLALALVAISAAAQESRGTILGRVIDPSGAPVAGAKVDVVNVDTNVAVPTTTNEAGNYQAPFLNPGNYTVRVDQPGFKRFERQGIRVQTNTQVTVDMVLELGTASESVTVTASAPLLTTAGADLGQVLDRSALGAVPVSISRNVLYNVRLAAGVTGGGGSITGNGAGNFSIAGGGSTTGRIEYLIDGIPDTVAHNSGGPVYIPSIDSVEEIKIQTTMFDAQYGHSNGGAINVTTRSGT